jgi:hypothetical protein
MCHGYKNNDLPDRGTAGRELSDAEFDYMSRRMVQWRNSVPRMADREAD